MKWYVKEEHSDKALELLSNAKNDILKLYAPAIILTEFLNFLSKPSTRKIISIEECKNCFDSFNESCNMGLINIFPLDGYRKEILELALQEKCSYYDAEYLYLAKKLKCNLFTFDKYLDKLANKL